MEIALYQIDSARDTNRLTFVSLDCSRKISKKEWVDESIYMKGYEGDVPGNTLEEVFENFNARKPAGYFGRSMITSDVVGVRDRQTGTASFFYRDVDGFVPIVFDETRTPGYEPETIRVVLCEPGRKARIAQIGTGLEDLQKTVGGLIEAYYPFDEEVCIVCNDEGKLNGMEPCRAVCGSDGRIQDIVYGPFFICGCSGENFGSLSEPQLEKYLRRFELPECFFRFRGEMIALPFAPLKEAEREL